LNEGISKKNTKFKWDSGKRLDASPKVKHKTGGIKLQAELVQIQTGGISAKSKRRN
jgi:hypothetical protein